MDMSLFKLQEMVLDREAWRPVVMGLQRVGYDWVTEVNWTEMIVYWISGITGEKAMAPHSSSLAMENPMEGGAW